MTFQKALTRPEGNDAYLHRLADDMLNTLKRMRLSEMVMPTTVRNHDLFDPFLMDNVSKSIRCIKDTATKFKAGNIDAETAGRRLKLSIPTMVTFLVYEITTGPEGGICRPHPETEMGMALAAYEKAPSMERAYELVGACVNEHNNQTHWTFDNLARAILFCQHVESSGMQIG